MLGFAALRDAAASLEGRDSNYFSSALGGFEAARERERLRAQGEAANRNQQMMNLIQMQALARAVGDPALEQFASDGLARIMGGMPTGGAGVTPRVTTGATPPVTPAGGAPGAGVVRPADQVRADLDRALDPETGGLNADGTPFETPEPVVEPLPEAAPTPAEAPADPIAALDAEIADIGRQIEAIIEAQPTGADVTVGAIAGIPVGDDPQAQARLARLQDREERLLAERAAAVEAQATEREAQAAAEQAAAEQAETESRMQPLIDDALNFLVDNGRIREGASLIGDQSAFASGVLTPGVSAGDVRLARAAVRELGAIAAMRSVREARAAGFGGSLSDADIALIQSSGGTFDLSEPEATVRTLQSLQAAMDSNGEAGDEDGYETVTTRFGDVRIRVRD
jgi:hypothetical protein